MSIYPHLRDLDLGFTVVDSVYSYKTLDTTTGGERFNSFKVIEVDLSNAKNFTGVKTVIGAQVLFISVRPSVVPLLKILPYG